MPADPVGFVPFDRDEIEQSIPSRFEQQVSRHPDRLAVKTSEHTWTYAELNREANRVAHGILARAGQGRAPVILLLEQSAPLIAAILGVLKAGKILLVLDPSHPRGRLAQFVDEVEPTAVVTTETHREMAASVVAATCAVIDLNTLPPTLSDANPGITSAADDVAMILYTSGSTGRPKGVLATHRNWVHNTWNYTKTFRITPDDRLTLLAFATSQAVKNLCLAILTGASLFPFDVRRQGLETLATLMRAEGITIAVMGASLFRAFADVLDPAETFPTVRVIRLGSEPLETRDVDLYRRHFPPTCLFVNGLASGETQTIRFFCIDHRTHVPGPLVPVGYPLEDKPVRLLDDAGREVGPGEVGEIVVEGPYLAPGYWRRPDLTEAAFRPPAIPGGPRRYHTGDLGRVDPDGCLVCLGRKNARVKVRGHGVDLLEVELALRAVDNVQDGVVVAHTNRAGYAYLVGYVAPRTFPGPTNTALREALRHVLPDFMIPTTFVVLGALPRTTSGKTDRQALPAPGRPYRDASRPATRPRTPTESAIAAIWAEVMDQESIDVHDHFYDLGGESLQALRIMARVRKTFRVDVDLQSLLDAPTVAELAQTIEERLRTTAGAGQVEETSHVGDRDRAGSSLVPIQSGDGHPPVFFVPGGIGADGEFFVYARLAHHVGPEYAFYGFKPRSADGKEPAQASVEEMAADYVEEIRSRQPDGPYVLIGDCAGGIVAYEIAQQLRGQGQRIGMLVLMDTPRPDGPWKFRQRSVASYFRGLSYHCDQLRRLKGRDRLIYLRHRGVRWLLDFQTVIGREPVQRSYSRAIHRYRPLPYDGKLTLLVSEELCERGPTLGWDGLPAAGIDVHAIPGDHTSCIRAHVASMARTLRACLERAAGGSGR